MNYDRRAKVQFDSVLFQAAAADKHVRDAYLSLHAFKAGLDGMEEVPAYLSPIYDQMMKALGTLDPAGRETHQLKEMLNRTLRSMGR